MFLVGVLMAPLESNIDQDDSRLRLRSSVERGGNRLMRLPRDWTFLAVEVPVALGRNELFEDDLEREVDE
ncbi:hypothetical protein WICPIJ_007851 [Wickerhamomyces pijperi]|uniref:Uncharacterized protein n=1 Tax=Wickerhamomyces pijperi TaxID=599730 RepID=A0A9P8TK10_WICPI|nr:hypothetical protein WICPIJ_007851 [Wickerhamomyces pijperi]